MEAAARVERGFPNSSDQSHHQHRSLNEDVALMLLVEDSFLGSHLVKTREGYTRGEAQPMA